MGNVIFPGSPEELEAREVLNATKASPEKKIDLSKRIYPTPNPDPQAGVRPGPAVNLSSSEVETAPQAPRTPEQERQRQLGNAVIQPSPFAIPETAEQLRKRKMGNVILPGSPEALEAREGLNGNKPNP
jgi:hypothetical protein